MTYSDLAVAATQDVFLYDCPGWGQIQVGEQDRLRFLHNQSTNNINLLQPGQGCDTVFVTSTGRTLDLATLYVTTDTVIALVSPQRREQLLKWLDRYIFFSDKVTLTDITDTTATFRLIGSPSHALLSHLGATLPTELGQHLEQDIELPGATELAEATSRLTIRLAMGSGLALPGYTLICAAADATRLRQILVAIGAIPLSESEWQQLRITQGRPMPEAELTEDYNPLEAGLWHTVSFNKGCYIGQETIARLNTYQGVKQQLWGIPLTEPVSPGIAVLVEGTKVGVCTSCTPTSTGAFALAYVKTKAGGLGLSVQVGNQQSALVDLPYLTRQLPVEAMP